MADVKFLYLDATGLPVGASTSATTTLGGLTLGGNIAMGTHILTDLGAGVNPTDSCTKGYVDALVITGGHMREQLLEEHQISDAQGILSAVVFTTLGQPVNNDKVTLSDGTTTRVYYFGTGTGDVNVTIGGSKEASMQNLTAAILGDASGLWKAYYSTALGKIAAAVVVIEPKLSSGAASKIYGVWATPTNPEIVDYTATIEYSSSTLVVLPPSVPSATNFGIYRTAANLSDGEMHGVRNNDTWYDWNADASVWYTINGTLSISDATSGSGGGTKGKITFDSDKGLTISSGVGAVLLTSSNPGLSMSGSGLTVKTDGAHGLTLGATGVEVMLVSGDRLTVGGSGIDVTGVPTLFKIAGTAVGVNVTGPNLDTLTGGSDTTLHSHARTSYLSSTMTVTESITKAEPYYILADGTIGRARADTASKSVAHGIALLTIASGAGVVVNGGTAPGVLTGATPGTRYFVNDTGGLVATTAPAAGYVMQVGFAESATALRVELAYYGAR